MILRETHLIHFISHKPHFDQIPKLFYFTHPKSRKTLLTFTKENVSIDVFKYNVTQLAHAFLDDVVLCSTCAPRPGLAVVGRVLNRYINELKWMIHNISGINMWGEKGEQNAAQ